LAAIANVAVICLFLPQELTSGRMFELLTANQAVTDSDPAVDPLFTSSRIDFPMVAERLWGHHLPGAVRLGMGLLVLLITGWRLRALQRAQHLADQHFEKLTVALGCLSVVLCV